MTKKIFHIFDIFLDFLIKVLLLKAFFKFLRNYRVFILSVLALILLALVAWFGTWSSSDFLNYKQKLIHLSEAHSALSLFSFFGVYFIVSLLGLPGTIFLGVIAGFVFGFLKAFFVSLAAIMFGSCSAFLIVRFFLRDFFIKSIKKRKKIIRLNKIYNRLKKNEIYYLITFRLFPFTPLAVTNIVMGLGGMKFNVFSFICFVTILPYLLIYVHIGSQLSQLKSWDDLYEPNLLISFIFLTFFPLLVKLIFKLLKKPFFNFAEADGFIEPDVNAKEITVNQN